MIMRTFNFLILLFALVQTAYAQDIDNSAVATVVASTSEKEVPTTNPDSVETDEIPFSLQQAYGWSDQLSLGVGYNYQNTVSSNLDQPGIHRLSLNVGVGARFEFGNKEKNGRRTMKQSLLFDANLALQVTEDNPLCKGSISFNYINGWSKSSKAHMLIGLGAEVNVAEGVSIRPLIRVGVEYKRFTLTTDFSVALNGSNQFMCSAGLNYAWSIKRVFDTKLDI